jgi:phytoene desaturase
MLNKNAVHVIGAGFAGLSAACFMAKAGWEVTVFEKLDGPGGRARNLKADGFTFDMGPSWYWMPDIFERFFGEFGKSPADFYKLKRLDPSYRVYWKDNLMDIPAGPAPVVYLFESIEPGSGLRLLKFLKDAGIKYREGMKMAYQPSLSVSEFFSMRMLRSAMGLNLFSSIQKNIHQSFNNPKLRMLLEFPSLFLGALPSQTPALYSLMNYADIVLGTWYPKGGLSRVAESMYELALSLGVKFKFNEPVRRLELVDGEIRKMITDRGEYEAGMVISAADYHFMESLLPKKYQSYSATYWDQRKMAPSCLLYYIGLNKKIPDLQHHTLFFDESFDDHGHEIYEDPRWPQKPLFYMSAPSVSDASVSPPGCENIFLLIPVAAGLDGDTEELREKYFHLIMERLENRLGESIRDAVIVKKTFALNDFKEVYHAYKGNAYGLANTLAQTAFLKPRCRSKKVNNLFYCGQLTVPGPGVPPALISGEIVAMEVLKTNPVKKPEYDFQLS